MPTALNPDDVLGHVNPHARSHSIFPSRSSAGPSLEIYGPESPASTTSCKRFQTNIARHYAALSDIAGEHFSDEILAVEIAVITGVYQSQNAGAFKAF